MKTSSRYALFAALACFVLAGGYFLWNGLRGPKPTADALIAQSLADAEEAARKRNVGGVMRSVSDDFKAGVYNKDRLRLLLLRSFRQSRGTSYDVHVLKPNVLPVQNKPKERIVITRLTAFYTDTGDNIFGSGNMTLVMREETERRYFLFSQPRWRIVSVVGAPMLPLESETESGNPFGL